MGGRPVGAFLGSLAMLASAAGGETVVRARVLDHGGVGVEVLRDAERIVDHVYRRSGVTFTWLNCDATRDLATDDCVGPAGPNDVSIRIADRETMAGKQSSDIRGGCAIPLTQWAASGIVYAYSDRVRRVSRDGGVSAALVLGTIVAHEIGHLLLPGGHSSRGIMRALMTRREWLLADQAQLGFTPVQSAVLKASGPGRHDFDGETPRATVCSHWGQGGVD